MQKLIFFIYPIFLIFNCLDSFDSLPTYFEYSGRDLEILDQIHSNLQMDNQDLMEWDTTARNLISKEKIKQIDIPRLWAYLYLAQKEAAFLSYNVYGNFVGSLDPISFGVLKLFFPKSHDFTMGQADTYSLALADIVLKKIKKRLEQENANKKTSYIETSENQWSGNYPFYGLETLSWDPWYITSFKEFNVAPPPPRMSKKWSNEVQSVKTARSQISNSQRKLSFYWAGLGGRDNGDWRHLINTFLFKENVPFKETVYIRAVFSMLSVDTAIATFKAKYHYLVKRPHMLDLSIKPVIDVPNHPSYPSAHSTASAMTAVLMTYFFPENEKKWNTLAEEAGLSRIWAGIHYPMDHKAGKKLGQRIAKTLLKGNLGKESQAVLEID